MTNAPLFSGQATISQQLVSSTPSSYALRLVSRLLKQYEEDLASGDDKRAQLVNTAILEQCRFLSESEAASISRRIERIIEQYWGICI